MDYNQIRKIVECEYKILVVKGGWFTDDKEQEDCLKKTTSLYKNGHLDKREIVDYEQNSRTMNYYNDKGWLIESHEYDLTGKEKESVQYTRNNHGDIVNYSRHDYVTSISFMRYKSYQYDYVYDFNGKKINEICKNDNCVTKYYYEGDNLVKTEDYDEKGRLTTVTKSVYDIEGNEISRQTNNLPAIRYVYDIEGNNTEIIGHKKENGSWVVKHHRFITQSYDYKGNWTCYISYTNGIKDKKYTRVIEYI